jgi:uncharacterized protein YkwD
MVIARKLLGLGALCASLMAAHPALSQANSAKNRGDAVEEPVEEYGYEPAAEARMFKWVNEERAKTGAPKLRYSAALARAARKHALLIVAKNDLSHQFPDEPALMLRIANEGLHFSASAENLATADTEEEMHQGLMHSPGHQRNILDPNYNALGIGVIKRGTRYFAVQDFARVNPDMGSYEAEQEFAAAVNGWRQKTKLPNVVVQSDPTLRRAVCAMAGRDKLTVTDLPTYSGAHGIIGFTSFDLKNWPESAVTMAHRPDIQRITVGSCYTVTKTYPGGTYWFGVVF